MLFLGVFKILSLPITACDYDYLLCKLFSSDKKRLLIAPIAMHPIMVSYLDPKLTELYRKFDYLVPDGQYVKWCMNIYYGIHLKSRIYGPELFIKTCKKAQSQNKNIFLCGNQTDLVKTELLLMFPRLNISDFDLKNKKIDKKITAAVRTKISSSHADIIFIGIGSPKQHELALAINCNKPVVCVGAAFDFLTGVQKQAPLWVGDLGLEWLFRLIQDPLRLSKRYIFDTIAVLSKLAKLDRILKHQNQ